MAPFYEYLSNLLNDMADLRKRASTNSSNFTQDPYIHILVIVNIQSKNSATDLLLDLYFLGSGSLRPMESGEETRDAER
jgi:hypothetical protein